MTLWISKSSVSNWLIFIAKLANFAGLAYFAEETAGIKAMTQPANPLDCKTARIFCVFKYARTVKQKVWSEAENGERDWEETVFSLASHTLASRAWDSYTTLTLH